MMVYKKYSRFREVSSNELREVDAQQVQGNGLKEMSELSSITISEDDNRFWIYLILII